jgi:lysophospholipid acyltransferase (LPLAT)-like uncharacterized protein
MIRLAAFSAAGLVRAWLATVRARARSEDGRVHPPDPNAERLIYAFWHESFLAPAKIRTPVKVLISQSADGELIAQVCQHLGLGTIRGSSKRGGAQALLQLLRDGENTHLAITPDGPRGPRRQVKTGVVLLASLTGLPIVPLGVGFTRAWRFRSWDRFALPRPFSTIAGVLGEPLIVPPDLDNAGVEQQRRRIEDAMLAATGAAEEWAEQIAAGRSPEVDGQRITPRAAAIRWQVGVRQDHESLVDTMFREKGTREKGTGPFCRNGP